MRRPIVFMYSGQGAQYYQMGKELYEQNPVFKASLDRCARSIDPLIGTSLVQTIYAGRKAEPFDQTRFTHPGNVALAWSLTQVLDSYGIRPDYLLGYSLGEYISAVVAGAIPLETALENVTRHALILEQKTRHAGMLAILDNVSLMQRRADLFVNTTLACHNFDNHFVVTGYTDELKRIERTLLDAEISTQMLPITHGFHSPIIEPARQDLLDCMANLFGPASIPSYSTVGMGPVSAYTPDHMWDVIRRPVRFLDTIRRIEADLQPTYVDVGPAGTLATFTKYALGPEVGKRAYLTINQFGRDLKSVDALITALR